MTKLLEALAVTIYASVLCAAILSITGPLFVGREAANDYLGFNIFLLVIAGGAVFLVVIFALRHSPIDSPMRGLSLGLQSAAFFYVLLFSIFGIIPAISVLQNGEIRKAGAYLGDMALIIAVGSYYGLPIILGALGGTVYGWVRSKLRHKIPYPRASRTSAK